MSRLSADSGINDGKLSVFVSNVLASAGAAAQK